MALDEANARVVYDLAERERVAILNDIPARERVAVLHVHLLAPRKKDTKHNARSHLLWWMKHFVGRCVVLVELSTGREADTANISDLVVLLEMYADAVEIVTSSARGAAQINARRNGAQSKGRPRKSRTKNRAEAEAAWRNPDIAGKRLKAALKKLKWTITRAHQEFGGRYAPADDEA